MPVEILELIVRTNVQEQSSATSVPVISNGQQNSNVQKQVIIQECVEQVLEILRHQKER